MILIRKSVEADLTAMLAIVTTLRRLIEE